MQYTVFGAGESLAAIRQGTGVPSADIFYTTYPVPYHTRYKRTRYNMLVQHIYRAGTIYRTRYWYNILVQDAGAERERVDHSYSVLSSKSPTAQARRVNYHIY